MLILKNVCDKNKSIYICDRCLIKMIQGNDDIYSVYVKEANAKNPKKMWDLCKKDYMSLCKGIRGIKKEGRL